MRIMGACIIILTILSTSGCTDDNDGPLCDAEALSTTLYQAVRGETVHVGECEVAGSFMVPDGVILKGIGIDSSILVSTGEGPVLDVTPGDSPPTVEDLSIRTDGPVGILAEGRGSFTLERVHVEATRGLGVALESLTSAELTDVSLSGPVTPENAIEVPPEPTHEETATHGLVLVSVTSASLGNISTKGFARMGALFVEGETVWRGGEVVENLATGLMVLSGRAELEDLVLCDTIEHLGKANAGVFASDAVVKTRNVKLCQNQGPGFLHDSVEAEHENLEATDNWDAAVWAQRGSSMSIFGTETSFLRNKLAGIVLVDMQDSTVTGAQIDESRKIRKGFWETLDTGEVFYREEWIGDGVQVVRPLGTIRLEKLALTQNERVGVMLQMDDSASLVVLEDIVVDGTGEEILGAVAQGGGVPDGWDDGFTRLGDTEQNDADNKLLLPPLDAIPEDKVLSWDEIEDLRAVIETL